MEYWSNELWNRRANLGKTCLKSLDNKIVHIYIIYRFGKRIMFILTIFNIFMMLFKLFVYDADSKKMLENLNNVTMNMIYVFVALLLLLLLEFISYY